MQKANLTLGKLPITATRASLCTGFVYSLTVSAGRGSTASKLGSRISIWIISAFSPLQPPKPTLFAPNFNSNLRGIRSSIIYGGF